MQLTKSICNYKINIETIKSIYNLQNQYRNYKINIQLTKSILILFIYNISYI